ITDLRFRRYSPVAGEQSGCDLQSLFTAHERVPDEYAVQTVRTDSEDLGAGDSKYDAIGLTTSGCELLESVDSPIFDRLRTDAAEWHPGGRERQHEPQFVK